MQSLSNKINIRDPVHSLSFSAILIFSFVFWFVWSFGSEKFFYRITGIEIGLLVFCAASFVSGLVAADKRQVISGVIILLSPILSCVLLIQILNTPAKIKLVLVVIAALGVVCAYQCADQFLFTNQMTIEQYEQSQQSLLGMLGIEPGTLQHFLFEHRLYSKEVRGFFTTSNSAGSFLLLAGFVAVGLFIEKYKRYKTDPSANLYLLTSGLATAAIIFGLILTKSKGAIIASVISVVIFIVYLCFSRQIKAHKKKILIALLILVLASSAAVVWYGLKHGRLPGGNSMFVRWQYWQATGKMLVDYPLTGVGTGNFANIYTRYKVASAPESVSDPHNFILSILAQYGPLGLIGFLFMIFMPFWKPKYLAPRFTRGSEYKSTEIKQSKGGFRILAFSYLFIISAAMLLIRSMLIPMMPAYDIGVILYIIVTLYVTPVAVFVIGFLLLTAPLKKARETNYELRETSIIAAGLFCAVIGVLLHNLIDFAIFEPGVLTSFWVVIACLIAIDYQQKSRPSYVLQPSFLTKISVAVAGLMVILIYLGYVLTPVVKSTTKIQQAQQAASVRQFEKAHRLLNQAAEDDSLSSLALALNGRFYMQQYEYSLRSMPYSKAENKDILLEAEKCLERAIKRNDADFKNYERICDVYSLLAEDSTGKERARWLKQAYNSISKAIELYPGCGRVHFKLAQIAELTDRDSLAFEHYRKTVDIEDSYRQQFKIMYPGKKEIVSRLGEDKYQFAIERMDALEKQQKQD
jgi:O-antigen ligase